MSQAASPSSPQIGRQFVLPTRRAVEIAWKNIRLRLSRSLLVTSGIVLALAFLMFILCSDNIVDGMRQWIQFAPSSGEFVELGKQQASLQDRARDFADSLQKAAALKPSSAGKPAFSPLASLGGDWSQLQRELGSLPLPPEQLKTLLTAMPDQLVTVKNWMAVTRQLRDVRAILSGPQQLAALMRTAGVSITASEIHAARIQTRWLIGLALLVAFVGILNAMLMSVTERFREIGTMKCLGALDSFIVKLFVIESFFQGVTGTLAGVLLGLLLSIVSAASVYGGFAWKMFPTGDVLLSAAICLFVGVLLTVAGAVYPAWQAARMHPIEAMRVEA